MKIPSPLYKIGDWVEIRMIDDDTRNVSMKMRHFELRN